MEFDTIAAIATPNGKSGIGIIRISGSCATDIAKKIYRNKKLETINQFENNRIRYGYIYDPDSKSVVDEVMVSAMLAPLSYTKEDIIEINCHGSNIILRKVLEVVLNNGARMAEPGEFTKRAFLNGRIDLAQAEAVIEYLNAQTDLSMKNAFNQLSGSLSQKLKNIRQDVLTQIAHIEAAIDYPDQDIPDIQEDLLLNEIKKIEVQVNRLLDSFSYGKILSDGIKTVIIGNTNVGKSSLLNYLLREDRAIVTDIPGTTRDILEANVNLGGVLLKIIDTAGIRETDDIVEKIGVEKARSLIDSADLLLAMFDSTKLENPDFSFLDDVLLNKILVLVNKIDLNNTPDLTELENRFGKENIILISIKAEMGLDKLIERIKQLYSYGEIESSDGELITNIRHRDSLNKAYQALIGAVEAIDMGMPTEIVSIDLKNAYDEISFILGESVSEDIIDKIFSEFCIGK